MKRNLIIFIAIALFLASCVKENTPTDPVNNTVDTTNSTLEVKGDFMNGPYGRVSGMAKIYKQNDSFILALLNVSISNGPDLHVYLSKEVIPVNFIDLGRLQSTNGNQLYNVPDNADLNQYKYALIHCKQFNHLFGSAKLD
jgi:hypothetical protein